MVEAESADRPAPESDATDALAYVLEMLVELGGLARQAGHPDLSAVLMALARMERGKAPGSSPDNA